MNNPIRVQLRPDEAWVVMAALRYYRDTYLDDDADRPDPDEGEVMLWRARAERVRIRIHRGLRRHGYPVPMDE